ncbi:MAG: hypothetical protein ACI9SC_000537 [Gammaproteobacteria bacterium]
MLTLGVSGLITAYILIALLLLSLNLYSRWSWQVKTATIVVTTLFYIVTYLSFSPLLGWPTKQLPPTNFRLIAAHVQQPDKVTGDEGAIYLWLAHINDLSINSPPRAYEFPYTNGLYEKIVNAKAKLNKGVPLLGEIEEIDDANKVEVEDDSRMGQASLKIQFYDLPDPLIPDK